MNRPLLFCTSFALLFGIGTLAQAQVFSDIWAPTWQVESMTSSVRFQGTALGTGPAEEILAVYSSVGDPQFPDPFLNASIVDSTSFVQPNGAMNSGTWDVWQQTSLGLLGFSTNMAQTAATTTDFGSPGATVSSSFDVTFAVNTPTTITLDGTVTGNPAPGSDDFGRVLFKQGNENRFHSGQQTFPFEYALLPGETYLLEARVFGHAQSNGSSASSIDLGVSLAPTPAIKYFDVADGALYITYVHPDGPGMTIVRPGELLRSFALDPKDQVVYSRVEPTPDGFAVVSRPADNPYTLSTTYFAESSCQNGRCFCTGLTSAVQFSAVSCDTTGPDAVSEITVDLGDAIPLSFSAWPEPTAAPVERGAYLVERNGQMELLDWQRGADGSQTTIDEPRVTVLGLLDPNTSMRSVCRFLADGTPCRATATLTSQDTTTMYDLGDLSQPGPLSPVTLGVIDANGTPFDPDMLRASSNAAGQPVISIQQGNSISLYEFDGDSLQLVAEQQVPAGVRGAIAEAKLADLLMSFFTERADFLYSGQLGQAASRVIGFDDFAVQLDASAPADTPTSYVSLKGNSAVTIDASFVAPPGMDRIDVTAAKDAVLRLNGDMHSENTYTTAGQRAAVIANGTLGGDVRSAGSEIARTVVVSNPPSGDVFDAATADALIASVNPAMLARLRESLGIDGSTPASESIDALVVSDVPGGTRAAHKSSKGDTHVLESSGETDIGYQDGNDLILRTKLRVFAGQASTGNPSLIGAVAPNAYVFASNDANTPAAQQLGQAAATALDAPASSINVSAWESLSLVAGLGNETVRGEITYIPANVVGGYFDFDRIIFAWDSDVNGSNEGMLLVELGIVTDNMDPDELGYMHSISGTPAEVAGQLRNSNVMLPEVEDEVVITFLRYTLTAAPGESAFFMNTSGLISLACDPNFDGMIDRGDAAILAQSFGMTSGATLAQGDCTGDGAVDLADLARLQRSLDASGPPSSASPVPEPSTFALLLCGTLLIATLANLRPKRIVA